MTLRPPRRCCPRRRSALARGRTVGEPVTRREFRRTDTLVVRAALAPRSFGGAGSGSGAVMSGRLLDRRGQPLTDLPVIAAGAEAPELRLALGSLGPGDYVIELTARSGDEVAQQYVAFRVVR